ncbi:MAG: OmpA family protein [Crocinitomicaceae bacterium]|nr:OmpA family protein [Crocinitomicaceae bacterium]
MKTILSTLTILLSVNLLFSQKTDEQVTEFTKTANELELVTESSRLIDEGYLYQAEIVVNALLNLKPDNANYNYRKGFLLLESRKDSKTALPFLLKAVSNNKKKYDAYSTKEISAPFDAFFHLGHCYHLAGDIENAEINYKLFLDKSFAKSSLVPFAKLNLKQCEVAKNLMSKPINVSLKNIGSSVNNEYPDYSPVISLDGSALYFTSRRPWEDKKSEAFKDVSNNFYPEDVYVSYMDFDSSWTEATKLDFCRADRNEATIAVSSDERKIYLYEDTTGNGDVYYSDFYGQKFNEIKKLENTELNSDAWETHCYLSLDKTKMYFVSDRPGGFGGRDIYVTRKNEDNSWGKAENLGANINTAADEDAPFLSVDGKQLFYSSNGDKSMGGFDVMVCEIESDGNWGMSKNVGYPFNSTNDDIFYTTTIDGLRGYMTSFRNDGFGEKDIYEIKNDYLGVRSLIVLKGNVVMSDGSALPENFPVSIALKCKNCDVKTTRQIYARLRDGFFMSDLQPGKEYELSYSNPDEDKKLYAESFIAPTENNSEIVKKVILDVKKKNITPQKIYTIAGNIKEKGTANTVQNAKVEIIHMETGEIIGTTNTDKNGLYKIKNIENVSSKNTTNFKVRVSKENYITETFDINQDVNQDENIKKSFEINTSDLGSDLSKLFNLKPIYFNFNKDNIRKDAKIELNKIVKILNENPTMEIELGSHTDCRGSQEYNTDLSKRRAESSAAYIKKRIKQPTRITSYGFGESKLVNICECEGENESTCSENQHQENRRTEFKITKK